MSVSMVAERPAVDAATFAREVADGYRPVILRGQVAHWEAVRAGLAGPRAMAEYLVRFGGGRPLEVLIGPAEIGGRLFYDEAMTGFNFTRQQVPLEALVGELLHFADNDVRSPHALYANAITAPDHLPGWAESNSFDLPAKGAVPRLWIGNAVAVATHFDASPNLACCVAGRRRFTLFPPEQVANLYLGPLDRTLAGPPVSMPDPEAPDFDRYPRYAEALRHAQIANLEPGDVLFIPAIWWHHVRSWDRLNVLVNYWWSYDTSATPFMALIHAIMSVRDLPLEQKRAWRAWYDHLVFADNADTAGDHLPVEVRGVLGSASVERTGRIRDYLIRMLGGR
jgi:hypothetical protein